MLSVACRFDLKAERRVDKANSKTFKFKFASYLFIAIGKFCFKNLICLYICIYLMLFVFSFKGCCVF